MRKFILAVVFLAICPLVFAQQVLNNDSIIKMVKAGVSDDLIVSTINASPGTYDITADGIIALKAAGTSDKVVAAIVAKAVAPVQPAQPVVSPPPPMSAPAPAVTPTPVQPAAQAPPPPPFHSIDGKIRIYVTDHPIFESNKIASGFSAVSHVQTGDDPRTVEIQADIQKVCPEYVITSNNPERADYILVFRRRGGERSSMYAFGGLTGLALSSAAKVNNASLFKVTGDMIYATKKNTVEGAINDICAHIPAPNMTPMNESLPLPSSPPSPPVN